jgi:hypothetical protein
MLIGAAQLVQQQGPAGGRAQPNPDAWQPVGLPGALSAVQPTGAEAPARPEGLKVRWTDEGEMEPLDGWPDCSGATVSLDVELDYSFANLSQQVEQEIRRDVPRLVEAIATQHQNGVPPVGLWPLVATLARLFLRSFVRCKCEPERVASFDVKWCHVQVWTQAMPDPPPGRPRGTWYWVYLAAVADAKCDPPPPPPPPGR